MSLLLALAISALMIPQEPAADLGKEWMGKQAKAVAVKSEDGTEVDLGEKFGKAPVVMVFYRGVW